MAMPLAWSLTRVTHQLEHGIWRMNPMEGDQKADALPCQRLDDVNKMTRALDSDQIDWLCRRKEAAAIGAPRGGAPILLMGKRLSA